MVRYFLSLRRQGWASCAVLAQHEVINRACSIPAEDAIAHGYSLRCSSPMHKSSAEHERSETTFLEEIKKVSDKMGMNDVCVQLTFKKRVFGVGLAIPRIDGADYEKPYNVDGIKKNSYKGFAVVDPYWMTYELDDTAQADPTSPNFYEPNYYSCHLAQYVLPRRRSVSQWFPLLLLGYRSFFVVVFSVYMLSFTFA